MTEDWFVILVGILAVVALPVALNFRGAADRTAEGNRRLPRYWSSGMSNFPVAPTRRFRTVRGVRIQATFTIIAALVLIVIGLK
jgi:hypothetical protein